MKARLIKKGNAPAPRPEPEPEPAPKPVRPGSKPAVVINPRAAFNALFAKPRESK